MMTSFSRVRLALAFVLLAGSPLAGQTPNFSKYVALGDSYGAGFGSGCLVAREQHFSYPSTIAKQLGNVDFQQPTVSQTWTSSSRWVATGRPGVWAIGQVNPPTCGEASVQP